MSIWLDVVGAFIFGALLVLNVMRMNADVTAHSFMHALTYGAQANAATIGQVMESDLDKMGLEVTGDAIIQADTTQIEFLGDLNSDGSADTLRYYIGPVSEMAGTPNPDDRFLYRVVNSNAPQQVGAGVTHFRLGYYNEAGDSLALPVTPSAVRQIRVNVSVESGASYDTTAYALALIELRLFPKNLAF